MSNDLDKNKKVPNVPNLRFKKYNDPWEKVSLSEIVNRITRKNKLNESLLPLTISAQYGLIDQTTFFGKTVASKDLSNYYLLFRGDFAYNKSYSKDYPWGAVKRLNNFDKGVVSNLYICFKPYNVNSDFLECYFETNKWNKEISDIAGEGARNHGLLNMSTIDFFSTKHYIPSMGEQAYISGLINKINERIMTQSKIINNLYSQKKCLKSIIFRNDISNHKIGDFLEEYTEKNVNNYEPVSVGKYGIRKRTEIFSRDLSEDYSKNKVIHKDSLTIGMGTKEIDIAILFEDSHYCVSPAYTTYKIKNIDPYYFNELLNNFNYLLSLRYMISGARQGKSVNKKELMNHQIFVHTTEQQSVIKNLLKSVDNKIDNETKLLEKYSQQKNYLLDNLFI